MVNQTQIDAFRQDGAVVLRGVLSEEWLDLLRRGLEEVDTHSGPMTSIATSATGEGRSVLDQMSSYRVAALADFVKRSPAAAIARQLLGESRIQYLYDQSFCKSPGRVLPSPWHQDLAYGNFVGSSMARTWMSIDAAPASISLHVVRGSHKPLVTYRAVPADTGGALEQPGEGFGYGVAEFDQSLPQIPDIDAHPERYESLGWDVEPGDMVVFDGAVIHGAGGADFYPNSRRAFAIMWGGADIRYCRSEGNATPDATLRAKRHVVDGDLISEYPDVFPIYG